MRHYAKQRLPCGAQPQVLLFVSPHRFVPPCSPRQLDDKVKDFLYFKSSNLLEFFEEAIKLPQQLTYPTPKELLWKGCLIMLSIMVLMVIISTIDTTFLYFVVKLMRKTA